MPLTGPSMSSIPESSREECAKNSTLSAKLIPSPWCLGTGSKYCCVQTPATLSAQVTFSAASTRSMTYAYARSLSLNSVNSGKSGWTGKNSFALEVPLHYLRPSVIYSVPCDRFMPKAYWDVIITVVIAISKGICCKF